MLLTLVTLMFVIHLVPYLIVGVVGVIMLAYALLAFIGWLIRKMVCGG